MMWARKRIDIGWSDFASGALRCLLPARRDVLETRISQNFGSPGQTLVCLSVRSGFDLLLATLDLPAGSEVLFSAVTIPDMPRIASEHALVPVPVDLDPDTLVPDLERLRSAITPRTRVIVVAHLFGSRVPMAPIHQLAAKHDLLVIEDCAQVFAGRDYLGDPASDVCMFSFGSIKTSTALGGAVLRIRDPRLLADMHARQSAYVAQSRFEYFRRLLKYLVLKTISIRLVYTLFVALGPWLGYNYSRVVNGAVRGFAGPDFFRRIRRQPSVPLLGVLARRLAKFNRWRFERRTLRGNFLAGQLQGQVACPGDRAEHNTYWVFPVAVADPQGLIAALARNGFDAAQVESMASVPAPPGREALSPTSATDWLSHTVYLPFYAEMPDAELERMAECVLSASGARRQPQLPQRGPSSPVSKAAV